MVRARELLLLGRVLHRRRGRRLGPDPRARCRPTSSTPRSRRWSSSSRGGPTVALGLTKWLLHSGADGRRSTPTSQDEAFALELSSRSEDFREGLAAFREKRDPEFQGR